MAGGLAGWVDARMGADRVTLRTGKQGEAPMCEVPGGSALWPPSRCLVLCCAGLLRVRVGRSHSQRRAYGVGAVTLSEGGGGG